MHPLNPTSGDIRECCFKLNHFEIKIMESLIKFVQDEFVTKKEFPAFSAGDTITVYYEIREGEKTRTQFFKGVVIQVKGTGLTKTFTIRKMSGTVGVERIFPINLPTLQKIDSLGEDVKLLIKKLKQIENDIKEIKKEILEV